MFRRATPVAAPISCPLCCSGLRRRPNPPPRPSLFPHNCCSSGRSGTKIQQFMDRGSSLPLDGRPIDTWQCSAPVHIAPNAVAAGMTALALITPPGTQPCSTRQPLRVVGIDLGTTNPTIAEIQWVPGDACAPQVRCLEVEHPSRQGPYSGTLVPSVVALQGGEVILGANAVAGVTAPWTHHSPRGTSSAEPFVG